MEFRLDLYVNRKRVTIGVVLNMPPSEGVGHSCKVHIQLMQDGNLLRLSVLFAIRQISQTGTVPRLFVSQRQL